MPINWSIKIYFFFIYKFFSFFLNGWFFFIFNFFHWFFLFFWATPISFSIYGFSNSSATLGYSLCKPTSSVHCRRQTFNSRIITPPPGPIISYSRSLFFSFLLMHSKGCILVEKQNSHTYSTSPRDHHHHHHYNHHHLYTFGSAFFIFILLCINIHFKI